MVRYVYDAWGNHEVKILDGTSEDKQATHIGNLNPFRYRGYYYDVETGLYFLKTRYYDPQICRFITIDDLDYLDPEHINGLNLYAYCVNNPVMYIDPTGRSWWAVLAFMVCSTFLGAAGGLVGAIINERNLWIGTTIGAIGGMLNGAATLGLGAIGVPNLFPIVAAVIGGTSEYLNQLFNGEEINWFAIMAAGYENALSGLLSAFIGASVKLDFSSNLSFSVWLSNVFYAVQTGFDFVVSKFANWFKKLFGIGDSNVGSGSGSGGCGGRSW